jgi:monofunctional biosynthetic peptidoglycan transglycosylase
VARVAVFFVLFFVLATVLPVAVLRWLDPPTTACMLQQRITAWRQGDRTYHFRHGWTDWDEISPQAGVAVVASEDQKFPHHHGFDLDAIADARREHDEGRRLRGASTITQQAAKNLFLWPGRSWTRKGLEAYFTILIEALWPKKRILEVYLNVAEFGRGIFGIGAASEAFFHTSPARLEPEQAALLAAVLPNPVRLRADRPSGYVLERRDWILKQMKQLGGPEYLRCIGVTGSESRRRR